MTPPATPPTPRAPWKPSIALVVFDLVAFLILGAGVMLYLSPGTSPLAGVLPDTAAMPLMAVGGGLLVVACAWIAVSILRHARGR